MPLPSPRQGENRAEFISRCISDDNVQSESGTNDQAVAICSTLWDERNMDPNEKLLAAIQARQQKKTEFGYGIITADKHVKNMVDACGLDSYERLKPSRGVSFDDCLRKARGTLVYSNSDMRVEEIKGTSETGNIELPKNTLMVFKHVLTTPRKDRDGDILRTQGAEVDPNMLLLWQHVHTLPIGKMLQIAEHNSNKLSLISAIVDMNELSHDAAVMVDNDMARFSHGFRALLFEELKEDEGEITSPGGFDIKGFEIMEESIVSVPSNVDAQVEEQMLDLIEGNRLTSHMMKEYGKTIRERRNVSVSVTQQLGDWSVKTEATGKDALNNAITLLKEVHNEDKSGSGSDSPEQQGQGSEGGDSPPEEAKTITDEAEATSTEDEKVIDEPSNEIIEEEPVEEKSQEDEKTGRRISRAVANVLSDVKDDLTELKERESLSRGGASLCERCIDKLAGLMENEEEETSTDPDIKGAVATILSHATSDDRTNLMKLLKGIERVESKKKQRETLRALVGH